VSRLLIGLDGDYMLTEQERQEANIESMQPAQLSKLCWQLSNEYERLCDTVAKYEVNAMKAEKNYKIEQGKALAMVDKKIPPSLAKMIIEADEIVIKAADALEQAQTTLIVGKANLAGIEAKYQSIKKIIELRTKEIMNFR